MVAQNMKRRNFIRVTLGVATQAAVAPAYLLADDEDDWKYYEAFGERLRRLVIEKELEFRMAWLAPVKDGRRHVTVFFKNAPSVEWSQPWGADEFLL